jgi:hypothetical protein
MELLMASELLTPDTRALAPVGHRPRMFFGAHSHERTAILQNVPADARGDMAEEAHERTVQRDARRLCARTPELLPSRSKIPGSR